MAANACIASKSVAPPCGLPAERYDPSRSRGRCQSTSGREPEVRVGDRIVLHKYAGAEITIDGVKHFFVKGEDILAIL